MSNANISLAAKIANLRKAIDAVQTKMPSGTTLTLNAKTLAQAQLVEMLEAITEMHQQVVSNKQAWTQAKQALSEARPANKKWLKAFRSALEACFGADHPLLAEFGFEPEKKRAKPTVEERAHQAAAARATRKQNKRPVANGVPPSSATGPNGSATAAQSAANAPS
jgi:Ribonuclease G/E